MKRLILLFSCGVISFAVFSQSALPDYSSNSSGVGAAVFPPYQQNDNQQGYSQQQQAPTYADGWNDGYKAGYCYGKGYGCYPPYPPYPPYPRYGEDSYKGGYNRGFLQGIADQK
jgi:hypothetical protein